MIADPTSAATPEAACAYERDGLLVVEAGRVAAVGAHEQLRHLWPDDMPVTELPGRLLMPGFIDGHIHFPQTDVMAAWSGGLLDWLEQHTFPAEMAFAEDAHARAMAPEFLDHLLRHGVTSALVFGSVHKGSVEALFEAALARNMRLIAGKVLMDRGAPAGLLDTVESGRADTEALIRAWRGQGRLGYAVTPRFAVTSTPGQLAMAGEVLAANPDVLLHTHMSENVHEIARVAELFPEARDYLDVYQRLGLVGPRSVFAHCVHADGSVFGRMREAGSAAVFCPSSNLLLGSGLFPLRQACACGVTVALGTDVGAGSSFSLLHALGEAYKVGQLRGEPFDPLHGAYLATLGAAKALHIDDQVGDLAVGKEADFVVLNPGAMPLLDRRAGMARGPRDLLFVLGLLGDDRVVEQTYLAGELAWPRPPAAQA